MTVSKETQEDCFADLVVLSPRLAWLKQHGLETVEQQLPRLGIGPRSTLPWVCHNLTKTVAVFGEDELDATIRMAELLGVKHWTLEQTMTEPTIKADDW